CQSDLKEMAGLREGPSQLGHEIVGVVAGSRPVGLLPSGQLVCLDPNVPLEHRGCGFAEVVPLVGTPVAVRAALRPAPPDLPRRRLVFAEPLACAGHCVDRAADTRSGGGLGGAQVAVVGAGIQGVLVALCALDRGARVDLYNRSPDRLGFLAAGGVASTVGLRPLAAVRARYDVVVATTRFAYPGMLRWGLRATADGGLLVVFGGTSPAVPGRLVDLRPHLDLDRLRRREEVAEARWEGRRVTVAGSYGTSARDFDVAFARLGRAPFGRLERLIVAEVDLGALPATLRTQLGPGARPLGKTVVRCGRG
ncbi:MAG TPA: hypothetical protein VKP11_11290, partial [Frankiaceae bacterium]|nr:hypothetical protein [Frankiaceae bacterium]